jgi:hypothetical protein
VIELELGEGQQLTDLFAVKQAAERCGMVFHENKKKFKYWGRNQKPCDHAIQLSNGREMGLVSSEKAPGTWDIKLDSMDRHRCNDLLMYYQMECARLAAEAQGDQYTEEQQEDGSFVVRIDTSARMGQ